MAEETNTEASALDSGISKAMTAAETAVDALIVADFPWAGLPVIRQIIAGLVAYIGQKFSNVLQGVGTFTVIDVQVGDEETAMSNELATLIQAEKGGDPNAIKQAIQAYADAQSALAHSDGSARPQ